MSYYNYHAECQKLIKSNHLIGVTYYKKYNHIMPAMVLYFDVHKPMPIREYKWNEYENLIKTFYPNLEIVKTFVDN